MPLNSAGSTALIGAAEAARGTGFGDTPWTGCVGDRTGCPAGRGGVCACSAKPAVSRTAKLKVIRRFMPDILLKTEDGGRRTEDGRRRTEDGGRSSLRSAWRRVNSLRIDGTITTLPTSVSTVPPCPTSVSSVRPARQASAPSVLSDKRQHRPALPDKRQHRPALPDKRQHCPALPDKRQHRPALPDKRQHRPPCPTSVTVRGAFPGSRSRAPHAASALGIRRARTVPAA